jgi:aminoglycoside phosphotransferase (APT) family kinase protein
VIRELLGREVESCVPRAGGDTSLVFEVRFAGEREPVIVKRYPRKRSGAKEVHVYRLLAEHGIDQVPRVLASGEDYNVLTLVPGRMLEEVSDAMDEAARFAVYRQLGEFLARLHEITMDAFGYLVTKIVDPKPDNTAYMTGEFAKQLAGFRERGGDTVLASALDRYVGERAGLFAGCTQAVLCHNDFHEANVLVDAHGLITGVIDMENVVAADPLTDIARTRGYSIRGDQAKWEGLVAGYGPAALARADVLPVYRLHHVIELWNWFTLTGRTELLAGLEEDMRHILN